MDSSINTARSADRAEPALNKKEKVMANERTIEQKPSPRSRSSALRAGTAAPDFTLHSTPDQSVTLRDFRGQPVVIAFYPADWSPVCGDQMTLYNEILPE